jgi:hypothetical protein
MALASRLAPLAVALLLAGAYADSFLRPTFAGDQGSRLDHADKIIVHAGARLWLPLLQLHIHALYLLHAPIFAYQLVPYAYTVASLFLLAALCRAAVPDEREALIATLLLMVAFAGSSFNWLGRSLYQETLVLPLFLGLIYLHYFAPRRRLVFVLLLAAGMLTREIFWIWWLVYVVLHWRSRLRDGAFRAGLLGIGLIPVCWLFATQQSPLLARNTPEVTTHLTGLGDRAAALAGVVVSEFFLVAICCFAAVFAFTRAARGLSFRSYHIFSLVSLAALYGYILLFDPWYATPGNTRALVPLFAHLLFWGVLAWRDAARVSGRIRLASRALAAVAILSMLKLTAIAGVLVGTSETRATSWEPLHLASSLAPREDWRAALRRVTEPRRAAKGAPLEIAFVGLTRPEYVKLWVAPFLYDSRARVGADQIPPTADVLIVAEGTRFPKWKSVARLQINRAEAREILLPESGS